jgi:hypothetical protein
MMVMSRWGVECSAKIAMTALSSGGVTVSLLPNHDPLRLIYSCRAPCAKFEHEFGRSRLIRTKFRIQASDRMDIAGSK